jgi:hypothetical protein
MMLDHELKLRRAAKHLQDLDAEIKSWLNAGHYSVRYEFDLETTWDGPIPPVLHGVPPGGAAYYLAGGVFIPGQGPGTAPDGAEFGQSVVTAYASVAEQPSREPISVLIGDALHNMRSALDTLAYALATAFSQPLTHELASGSEFPIFGDEDRKGTTGVGSGLFHQRTRKGLPAPGSGLAKTQGWDPRAQTVVEGLQPYKRGNDFRSDPLWILHDLDRVSKHRLLHTGVASFAGTLWDLERFTNVRCLGPGLIQSFGGAVQTDTPIGRIIGIHPIDPSTEMHVGINPAMDVAFGDQAPVSVGQPVLATSNAIYMHIRDFVLPPLARFL